MNNLIYLEKVDSTNTYVKNKFSVLEDKTVVYTSYQTNGRGRLNHIWNHTGKENIYMTICLKPEAVFLPKFNNITQYMCVILCQVLEKYGVKPTIKWPNDILINGAKIAGILAESSFQGGQCSGIALGVGVNLNSTHKELHNISTSATSLNLILGDKINREEFLNIFIEEFFKSYDKFLNSGFELIKDEYITRTNFIGEKIILNYEDKKITGFAEGISDFGEILLNVDGKIHKYNTGELVKL